MVEGVKKKKKNQPDVVVVECEMALYGLGGFYAMGMGLYRA